MNKTNEQIARFLQSQGWKVIRGKHYKAFPPDKTKPGMAFPLTPSDRRGVHNLLVDIRRRGTDISTFTS